MQTTLKSQENDFDMLRLRLISRRQEDSPFEQMEFLGSNSEQGVTSPYNSHFLAALLACLNATPLQSITITLDNLRNILPLPALYIAAKTSLGVKLLVCTPQAVATLLSLVLGVKTIGSRVVTALETSLLETYLQKILSLNAENLVLSHDFNLVLGLNLPTNLRLHYNAQIFCIEPLEYVCDVVVAQATFPLSSLKIGAKLNFGEVNLSYAKLISPHLPPHPARLTVKGDDIFVTKV